MRRRPIRERLARTLPRDADEPPDVRGFLRRRLPKREPVALPPGDEHENERGVCFVRRLEYSLATRHGAHSLALAGRADWARIAERARDDRFAGVSLGECLFLDTETTGLSGGAGTTVFLTGLGFVDGDALVVEQVFLRAFADEPAALAHVARRLRERPVLVTYVGKSFDRHRLHARMGVHRVASAILDPRHLDLYYLARRAWKDELPDVRLQTVERERLGFTRRDDLPGSEAPRAFLDWVRDGTGEIDRVFEHNRLDVLSLVSLLGVLGRG